jgi:hypothetical protein
MTHFQPIDLSDDGVERFIQRILKQEEEEIVKETMLMSRINRLPEDVQRIVGEFSPVVKEQRFLIKFEYFDKWIIDNTDRIMGLVSKLSKPHVGFILNSVCSLNFKTTFDAFTKRGACYGQFTAEGMRIQIKYIISQRNKTQRDDIIDDLKNEPKIQFPHKFVPCKINPSFDDLPIRVYGAYKAIEEYDTRLKISKAKKSKEKAKEQSDKAKAKKIREKIGQLEQQLEKLEIV